MTKRRRKAEGAPVLLGPFAAGVVTRTSFVGNAQAFVRSGLGAYSTIRNAAGSAASGKPETPERWVAWMAFLGVIDDQKALAFASGCGEYSVPAIWPWEFSLDAGPIEGRLHGLLAAYERHMSEEFKGRAPEAKLRTAAVTKDWKKIRAEQAEQERAAEEERLKALGEQRKKQDEIFRIRTFEDQGVEAPELKPGQIGMTLTLMLTLGWEIIGLPDGRRVMARKVSA
jgi:hypothetical protein